GFTIGNIGYVGFGRTSPGGTIFNDLWAYDPATDQWAQRAPLPAEGRSAPGVFVLDGKAYVCCGNQGGNPYLNDLWEYDPLTDAWEQRAALPATGRSGPIAFAAFGKGYVGSGNDNSSDLSSTDFWEWDPVTDDWTQRADIPGLGRRHGCAFVINGTPYAGGGWNGTSYFVDYYAYNAGTNFWTPIANYGGAGAYTHVAFAIGDKGYVGTGGTSGGVSDEFWEYRPGSAIGLEELGPTPAIQPVLSNDRILLGGWAPALADRYALIDHAGRMITSGVLRSAEIPLPEMANGAYVLRLEHGTTLRQVWTFTRTCK
ncbi:MAG TPA: kelch repeat-containing protein, partial [Flavobacteriales bacterium]|nr:kelch repeat-containing protein [Flavobacteriales bacterium]